MKLGSKPKQQKVVLIRVLSALVLLCCLLLVVSVFKRYQIERQMAERRAVLETEKEMLVERKVQLQEEVDYLLDERSVEAEIRRSFDVAKEGEQVVVILDNSEPEIVQDEVMVASKAPWYMFWR